MINLIMGTVIDGCITKWTCTVTFKMRSKLLTLLAHDGKISLGLTCVSVESPHAFLASCCT